MSVCIKYKTREYKQVEMNFLAAKNNIFYNIGNAKDILKNQKHCIFTSSVQTNSNFIGQQRQLLNLLALHYHKVE